MAKKILAYIILFVLLCTAAFFVQSIRKFKALPVKQVDISGFPLRLGKYKGRDLELEERVYAILNTETILFREYSKDDNMPLWLLIVYGEEDRQSFHPPEYCYLGGADVKLLSKERKTLVLDSGELDVNKVLFGMPDHRQLVCYWYTAGDKATASYYEQQLFFVLGQMKREKIGGTLIRVSTVVLEGETEKQAVNRIVDFLNYAISPIKEVF